MKAWDIGAGGLILEEAGGQFTDLFGNPIDYKHAISENEKFHIFGSNKHLHKITLNHFEKVRNSK